jgi:dTMP kinase
MSRGRFIAFEGGEGAGKSTQIARLADALRARGDTVVVTREPGGTPGAEEIRALFVRGETGRWTVETDVLLVTAARADHVARLIRPALAAGSTVLCDRFIHSTLAYQGHGKGVRLERLLALHEFATGDLWPDLVLWLDLPVELGLARSTKRAAAQQADLPQEQRFEALGLAYHEKVRSGFARLAAQDPRIVRIDATQDIDGVAAAIAAAVLR